MVSFFTNFKMPYRPFLLSLFSHKRDKRNTSTFASRDQRSRATKEKNRHKYTGTEAQTNRQSFPLAFTNQTAIQDNERRNFVCRVSCLEKGSP